MMRQEDEGKGREGGERGRQQQDVKEGGGKRKEEGGRRKKEGGRRNKERCEERGRGTRGEKKEEQEEDDDDGGKEEKTEPRTPFRERPPPKVRLW